MTNVTTVSSLLQLCCRMITLPPLGLGNTPPYPWILWILWNNMNKFVFENKLFSEESSVLKAMQDARAWNSAQPCVDKASLPPSVVSIHHFPPPSNSYTWSVFSDAAWNASNGNCGLGWCLRDDDASHTEESSYHCRSVPSTLVAEALAVKAAINATVSSHVRCLNVFSDSKALILKSQAKDVVLKGILHDISILASSFESIPFNYLPRLANVVADSLAKSALYSFESA